MDEFLVEMEVRDDLPTFEDGVLLFTTRTETKELFREENLLDEYEELDEQRTDFKNEGLMSPIHKEELAKEQKTDDLYQGEWMEKGTRGLPAH